MEKVSISEFKALCLRLLDRVSRTREPFIVTRNGEPLVVIYPYSEEPTQRAPFGAARGTIEIVGDIVAPTEEEWEALRE